MLKVRTTGSNMLQICEGIRYKGFKERVRVVQDIEKKDKKARITIYDDCIVVSKLEEETE